MHEANGPVIVRLHGEDSPVGTSTPRHANCVIRETTSADVRFWHKADIPAAVNDVRFWG